MDGWIDMFAHHPHRPIISVLPRHVETPFLFFSLPPFSAGVFLTCTTVETLSVVIIEGQ